MPFAFGHIEALVAVLGDDELAAVGGTTIDNGLLVGNACSAVDPGGLERTSEFGLDSIGGATWAVLDVRISAIVDIGIACDAALDIIISGIELVMASSGPALDCMIGACCEVCMIISLLALGCSIAGLDPAAGLPAATDACAEALGGLVLAAMYS